MEYWFIIDKNVGHKGNTRKHTGLFKSDKRRINNFLEKTASSEPVPGGGSIAALSAATAAALTEMVANLTIGKKKYIKVEEEMQELVKTMSLRRKEFIKDIDRDADSYNQVIE